METKNKLDKIKNWFKGLKKQTKYQIGIILGVVVIGIVTISFVRPQFFLGNLNGTFEQNIAPIKNTISDNTQNLLNSILPIEQSAKTYQIAIQNQNSNIVEFDPTLDSINLDTDLLTIQNVLRELGTSIINNSNLDLQTLKSTSTNIRTQYIASLKTNLESLKQSVNETADLAFDKFNDLKDYLSNNTHLAINSPETLQFVDNLPVYNETKQDNFSITTSGPNQSHEQTINSLNGIINSLQTITIENCPTVLANSREISCMQNNFPTNYFKLEPFLTNISPIDNAAEFNFEKLDTLINELESIIAFLNTEENLKSKADANAFIISNVENEKVKQLLLEIIEKHIQGPTPETEINTDDIPFDTYSTKLEATKNLSSQVDNYAEKLNTLDLVLETFSSLSESDFSSGTLTVNCNIPSLCDNGERSSNPPDANQDPQDLSLLDNNGNPVEDYFDIKIGSAYSPTSPKVNQAITFTVEIENSGTKTYTTNQKSTIKLINTASNTTLKTKEVNSLDLDRNEKTTATFTHTFTSQKTYNLKIEFSGPLTEKTLTNNSKTFNLRVSEESGSNNNSSQDLLDDFNNARSLADAKEALEKIITTESYDNLSDANQDKVVQILRDNAANEEYTSLADIIKDFVRAVNQVKAGGNNNSRNEEWPPTEIFNSDLVDYDNKPQPDLSRFCDQNKILTEWWGPAMRVQIQRGIIQGYERNGCPNAAGEVDLTAEQVIQALARYSKDFNNFKCSSNTKIHGSYSPWAKDAICYALENSEIYEKTRWNDKVTRVYTLRLVLEAAGIDILDKGDLRSLPFSDLTNLSDIYLQAIDLGLKYNIMFGQNNGNKFDPHGVLNRAQFVTILNRVFP